MDLVSILVPCYNHANYIDDCLKSICEQSYKEIEVIICDDCSSDDSFHILKTWEGKLLNNFSRVFLLRNEVNEGVCKTLNRMLCIAKGRYIKILASDDMLLPNAILDFVHYASKLNDYSLIFSNGLIVDNSISYNQVNYNSFSSFYDKAPNLDGNLTGRLLARDFIYAAGVFIPSDTFRTIGVFDEKYVMEDFEYWLRASLYKKFVYFNKCTVAYRLNPNSLTHYEVDSNGIQKYRKFCRQKVEIFETYKQYASKFQQSSFFDNLICTSIGLNDDEELKALLRKAENIDVKVFLRDKILIVLYKLRIYNFLRDLKRKLICKIWFLKSR